MKLRPGSSRMRSAWVASAVFGAAAALLGAAGEARADTCYWYQGGRVVTSSDAAVCASRAPSPQVQARAASAARTGRFPAIVAEARRASAARRDARQTDALMLQATQQVHAGDYAGARDTFEQLDTRASPPEVRDAARQGMAQMDARLGGSAAPREGRARPTFGEGDQRLEAYGRTIPPACQQSVLDMVQGRDSGDSRRAMRGFTELETHCPEVLLGMAEEAGIRLPRRVYSEAALRNIRMAMGEDPATIIGRLFNGDPTDPVVAAGRGKPEEPRDPGSVMGALVDGRLQAPRFELPDVPVGEVLGAVGDFILGVGGVAVGVLGVLAGQSAPTPTYATPYRPSYNFTPAPRGSSSTITGIGR